MFKYSEIALHLHFHSTHPNNFIIKNNFPSYKFSAFHFAIFPVCKLQNNAEELTIRKLFLMAKCYRVHFNA